MGFYFVFQIHVNYFRKDARIRNISPLQLKFRKISNQNVELSARDCLHITMSNYWMIFITSLLLVANAPKLAGQLCRMRSGYCLDTAPFINGKGRCERSGDKMCGVIGSTCRCRSFAILNQTPPPHVINEVTSFGIKMKKSATSK